MLYILNQSIQQYMYKHLDLHKYHHSNIQVYTQLKRSPIKFSLGTTERINHRRVVQVAPVQLAAIQEHVLGAVHVPPFEHVGEHTATFNMNSIMNQIETRLNITHEWYMLLHSIHLHTNKYWVLYMFHHSNTLVNKQLNKRSCQTISFIIR